MYVMPLAKHPLNADMRIFSMECASMDNAIINTASASAQAVAGIGQGVMVAVVVIIVILVLIIVLPAISLLSNK
jgi:hypothetical protein